MFRRNWRLKIAAFLLAVLLWATIRVGAVSQQDLPDVHVRVENDDPNWVTRGTPSPSTVQLGLTGPARDLFRVAVDRPVVVVPIDRVLSEDTVIILRTEWVRNADRPGVVIEIPVTSVFHYRAGRQVERWIYPDDAAAWEAIFDG